MKKTIEPKDIAQLIILGQINKGTICSKLLHDVQDIFDYENPRETEGKVFPSGYEVNHRKVEKYRDIIVSPHWQDKDKTRNLVFYCLSGRMYRRDTLKKFTAVFSKSSQTFSFHEETLETEMFTKFPDIRY